MNKFVELPLAEPMYATYHFQGTCTATAVQNPSIRNWVLNEVMILACNRSFLSGKTTPNLNVLRSAWQDNPYLERISYPPEYAGGYINPIIRNLLDHGYYVCFGGVDDYYVKGKSWYKVRHFRHDGLICGYNRLDKTYCIYAYDSNWVYRKFWTPQSAFDRGREAILKKEGHGEIHGIRAKSERAVFSPETAYKKLLEYLNSSLEKYPIDGTGNVFGIIVQEYIAMYIGRLYDGSIPYERMDRRVLRLIWEHKKVMLERIAAMEQALGIRPVFSKEYQPLAAEADTLRMLYASHFMKRRDAVLPVIRRRLSALMAAEREILTALTKEAERSLENGAMAISES